MNVHQLDSAISCANKLLWDKPNKRNCMCIVGNVRILESIVARGSGPWQRDSPQGCILSPFHSLTAAKD